MRCIHLYMAYIIYLVLYHLFHQLRSSHFELKLIVALGFLQSFRVIQTLSFISRLVLVRESPPLGGARISIIVKKK